MSEADRVWRERGLREAVLAGDERAWRTWYDESFPGLDAYVRWRCGGVRDLADEALQEIWLTAVRRVRDFDPARATFAAWLRGIAVNVLRNWLRRRMRNRQTTSLGSELGTLTQPRSPETGERIAHALAQLPERYEQVLRLKYLEGRTMDSIAAEWGVTPKAIESLLTRARQAFREAYGAS